MTKGVIVLDAAVMETVVASLALSCNRALGCSEFILAQRLIDALHAIGYTIAAQCLQERLDRLCACLPEQASKERGITW